MPFDILIFINMQVLYILTFVNIKLKREMSARD